MSNLSKSLAQSLAGARLSQSLANRYSETLSDNDLVYTRDCPDTIFYNNSTKNFAPNEKAYVTYKGHKLYQIQGASEQLIDHDMDGSHSEWTSSRMDFDSNINPQKWMPNVVNNTHYNNYPISVDGTSYYTWSAILKAGEYYKVRVGFQVTGFTFVTYAIFNLSTGTIISESNCTAHITPCGNGKYYCSVTALSTVAVTCNSQLWVYDNDGNDTFSGNGSDGIYFYGAKCEQSAFPTSYHRGGVNLFEYSQAFEESGVWLGNRATPYDNSIANPIDGEITACFLEETVDTGSHFVRQNKTVDGSSDYCFSVYLKAKERYKARVWAYTDGFPSSFSIDVNLSTGSVISETGTNDYGIEDCGNGWYRCWITQTSDAALEDIFRVYILDDAGNDSYEGDGSSGLYCHAAQLEINDEPSTYEYTTDSANFGIRVACNAYWDSADVKDWVYTGKWKFYWIPNFDSATKTVVGTSKAMFFDPSIGAGAYIHYSDADKVELIDIATGTCLQSAAITCERGDIFEIQIDYSNAELTVIKNGSINGPYSGSQWVLSGDLDFGSDRSTKYCEGFLSKPIRA